MEFDDMEILRKVFDPATEFGTEYKEGSKDNVCENIIEKNGESKFDKGEVNAN